MSKITWSDVIASIDLSDKPVRNPKRLSQDEIADIKTKCNPKYDLTILDLICTIEGYQETLRKAREAIKAAWSDGSANAAMGTASEALTAINRAIGGKEDA
jgi:hypothetical protein